MTREEFQSLHDSTPVNERGCRRWPLSLRSRRYPQVAIDGCQQYGHRIALELRLCREIKPGYQALHKCDNSWCFSQDHLYEGTRRDNTIDSMNRLGLTAPVARSRGPNHRLVHMSREDIVLVREMRDAGATISEIAGKVSRERKYIEDVYFNRKWMFVK